jgi:hypothetical protein
MRHVARIARGPSEMRKMCAHDRVSHARDKKIDSRRRARSIAAHRFRRLARDSHAMRARRRVSVSFVY